MQAVPGRGPRPHCPPAGLVGTSELDADLGHASIQIGSCQGLRTCAEIAADKQGYLPRRGRARSDAGARRDRVLDEAAVELALVGEERENLLADLEAHRLGSRSSRRPFRSRLSRASTRNRLLEVPVNARASSVGIAGLSASTSSASARSRSASTGSRAPVV